MGVMTWSPALCAGLRREGRESMVGAEYVSGLLAVFAELPCLCRMAVAVGRLWPCRFTGTRHWLTCGCEPV